MRTIATAHVGRYELLDELGRGSATVVYKARDPEIDRIVAIKILSSEHCATSGGRDAMSERVKAAGGLAHPGIIKIFDLGESSNPEAVYFVTEFVDGQPLDRLLATGPKLAQAKALAFASELLSALSYAHSQGVTHGNLKPSNVLITTDQHVKISDFYSGRVAGRIGFVAPEQLKGQGDRLSDLFSVGSILYFMLSGHKPFQGNTDATISFKLVHQHPVPVAALDLEISPELNQIVDRLMAKDPAERYQSAAEALHDIQNLAEGADCRPRAITCSLASESKSIEPPTKVERKSTGLPVPNIAIVALASIVCAAVLATGKAFWVLNRAVPSPPVFSIHIPVPNEVLVLNRGTPGRKRARSPRAPLRSKLSGAPFALTLPLAVELLSPFDECKMTIWVDDRLAYVNSIRREQKKRFLGLGRSTKNYLTLIQVPAGERLLRIRIESASESFDSSAILATNFKAPGGQKLRIRCDRDARNLQLEVN